MIMRRGRLYSRIANVHPVKGAERSYALGYEAGYALGFELGRAQRNRIFDGTSIILPVDSTRVGTIRTIERIEAFTPHPYELIVASAECSESTKKYLDKRSGCIRHIMAKPGEGIARMLGKATQVSAGKRIMLWLKDAPISDGWINELIVGLDRDDSVEIVGVRQDMEYNSLAKWNSYCFMFRRELLSRVDLWNDESPTLQECLGEWISQLPVENVKMIEGKWGDSE